MSENTSPCDCWKNEVKDKGPRSLPRGLTTDALKLGDASRSGTCGTIRTST